MELANQLMLKYFGLVESTDWNVGDEWRNMIPKDTLAIPFCVALFFTTVHSAYALFKQSRRLTRVRDLPSTESESIGSSSTSLTQAIRSRAKEHGGWIIYLYEVARLIGSITLLLLSFITVHYCRQLKYPERTIAPMPNFQCPETFMTLTYIYLVLWSLFAVCMLKPSKYGTTCSVMVLVVTLGVYTYRDIWPFATYTEEPADIEEGYLIWAKIVALVVTAVLIPLFIPTQYIPVDPKNPMPIANPELTCSLFSFITHSYIAPVIYAAQKTEHLDADQLPPLSDTDASRNLVKKAFPHMDPFRRKTSGHIFFGLLRTLRTDYVYITLAMVVMSLIEFITPVCIYHILNYLENGQVGDNIRPWFWILGLLCGPILQMGFFQYYVFMGTRVLVHIEAILTALIFEHSLRIRFTAEPKTDEETKQQDGDSVTAVNTPDNTSDAGVSVESTTESQPAASLSSAGKVKSPVSSISPPPGGRPTKAPTPIESENKVTTANLVGKINNLVTADVRNITDARNVLYLVVHTPVQIGVGTFFLYKLLGWSSLVGILCMVVLLPVPGYITKLIQDYQRKKMEKSDKRIQIITEVVNVLRMVKLFGWEQKMLKMIQSARNEELLSIWWLKVLRSVMGISNSLIPTIAMLTTYVTYTVIMKKELTPSVIFSSLTIFDMLRSQLFNVSWHIADATQAKVSLDRFNEFFKNSELLDPFVARDATTTYPPEFDNELIGFKNASFIWSLKSADDSEGSRSFKLRVDGELFFQRKCLNLIVGPTGSGKTSLLMALLGEMHFIPGDDDSWFNLPREGGVAYAAQESWVQNDTIRENILFGSPYNESRYKQVLAQCVLERDLELFDAGDSTEVGEKGITLSGGQKARLTLARAIYSPAKIILLDDILAALDVHTSMTIVNKCFQGDLVKGRTIILVTHNIGLMLPIADFVVSIGRDGTIKSQGDEINTIALDPVFAEQTLNNAEKLDAEAQDSTDSAKDKSPANGRLVMAEEIVSGHVTLKSLKLFLTALGNGRPILFLTVWLSTFMLAEGIYAFQKWFLGYWGSQYETHNNSEVDVTYYCTLYACIIILFVTVSRSSYIYFVSATIGASRTINNLLVDSVLGSTLRWLDETPTARIITRFTQDIQAIDGSLPEEFHGLISLFMTLFSSLAVVFIFTPVFVAPAIVIAAFGFYIGSMYVKAQLSSTREKSNARSPVLAHFSAAITGIVSVRAYGAQSQFKEESMNRIDKYLRISRVTYNLNRWIGVRIDILGGTFSAGLAAYLVYGRSIGASNTGFSLNMTAELCSTLLYLVRYFNDFEVQANSLERIQGYLDIDHEPKAKDSGKPPAAWPTSGELVVEKLSARYSKNGPAVLHDISFRAKSGERIGIVGRTGSGKSSLTLALLRLIITEGNVYYDGIETSGINLEDLRSNITIIPQTPELISGSLRRNLDPFDQYDDAELNDALRAAGLFELQDELGESRITLDSNIASAGGNLSVGERQILALARAMIRRSKLLILDEATSAIDHKTDTAIQTTLRHKLDPDVTVITVAHRLQTIMDADKIMVLDDGRVAEFDTPKALLESGKGLFKALVDDSSDRNMLYQVAGLNFIGSTSSP